MAYFGADENDLRELSYKLRSIENEINNIVVDSNVIATIVSHNPSLDRFGYARMIREANSSTEKSARKIAKLSSALEQISVHYATYENRVIASPFDESSNGAGSPLGFGSLEDAANPFVEFINEDGSSDTPRKSTIIRAIFDYLKEINKNKAGNYFGLFGGLAGFFQSWKDLFSGNCEYGAKKTYFDLSKNGIDSWKAMYDIFASHFSNDNGFGTGVYSRAGQTGAGVFGLTASTAGIISTVYELINTQHQNGWDTTGDWVTKLTDSGTDFGKSAYEVYELARYGKSATSVYSPVTKWMTLVDTVAATGGQTIKSIGKYSADGKWDLDDTCLTAVESSVSGLYAMVKGLSFGLISEDTTGVSAEDISNGLENWARDAGKALGNWCIEHNCTWLLGK